MYKKLYIKPAVKTYVPKMERHMLAGTEDTGDPADMGGAKGGFLEDDNDASAWGNVWK